jgi:S1-C subfamily serine protease
MTRHIMMLAAVLFFSAMSYTQGNKEQNINNDETFKLPEVEAFIIKDKANIKVQFLAPEKFRRAEYKNVDLKKDDIIIAANGKAVSKAGDLKEIYEKLKPGTDLKLEVKRGGKAVQVTIRKGAPKDMVREKSTR